MLKSIISYTIFIISIVLYPDNVTAFQDTDSIGINHAALPLTIINKRIMVLEGYGIALAYANDEYKVKNRIIL